jgi:hypothetical protein
MVDTAPHHPVMQSIWTIVRREIPNNGKSLAVAGAVF